ncbi:MAG: alpha/beta fold hydrolase [Gemmatimonadaceae bacterium]|nr:alpha/beta fold hydrolase [Gemmatimonadaceae bacterium]
MRHTPSAALHPLIASRSRRRSRRALAVLQLAVTAALAGCAPVHVAEQAPASGETVVLLHGLARSSGSMEHMARSLANAGYHVCNIDYPSREHDIATLARDYVAPRIAACAPADARVHFVTHSLGGIVVRQLAASGAMPRIGRVVMLGPPNRGSEVVDALGDWRLFRMLNGPAGRELGTADTATPRRLGAASFPVGVIAGTRSVNWILSLIIPGEDDGKVAVRNARLDGMRDFAVVSAAHPFLMNDAAAIAMTIRFLAFECFTCDASRPVPPARSP